MLQCVAWYVKGRAQRSGVSACVRLVYVKIPQLNVKLSNLVSWDTTLQHTVTCHHPRKKENKGGGEGTAKHGNTKQHALHVPAIEM